MPKIKKGDLFTMHGRELRLVDHKPFTIGMIKQQRNLAGFRNCTVVNKNGKIEFVSMAADDLYKEVKQRRSSKPDPNQVEMFNE